MSDVFISYAREDLERVRLVATALESRGWSVWWDRRIVAGQTFDQTIERELDSAKSVVVLWSKDSIESEWTKNEATVALERNMLVPALLDDVRIPLEFRRKQTANLIDWNGEASHEGFQALCEGIAGRLGVAPVAATVRAPPPPPNRGSTLSGWRTWTAVAGVAVVALVAGVLWWKPDGGPSVAMPTVRSGPPPDANGIDNPAPLALGEFHRITLDTNEDYYFRLPSPAVAVKVVQDMRVEKTGILESSLSLLDQHGAVLQATVLRFSEYGNDSRKTAELTLKQANTSLRLLNTGAPADIWLAVLAVDAPFVPFFGTVTPKPISVGANVVGALEPLESAYYTIRLVPAEYRAVVDFSNAKQVPDRLEGFLALLDADGGNAKAVVRFIDYDITRRKVETFSVKKDEPRIFRVHSTAVPVNYTLKIEKIEAPRVPGS